LKKWILILSGVLVLLAGAAAGVAWWWISAWADTPLQGSSETLAVDIPQGAGPRQVAKLLAEHKVIADAEDFYRWVRYIQRASGELKAGELAFRGDLSPNQVLQVLRDGTPITHKITVPEGKRIDEIAAVFEQAGLADAKSFERRARDPQFVRSLGVPHDSLEGFLFPETYQLRKHTPVDEILKTLVAGYQRSFTDAWRQKAKRLGMTELQVVTLASIVEKETGAAAERPIIAGVFHNRLRQNWKLQTDPTVIYAEILATGSYDGAIHRSDLERDHPYNTYRRKGLPPGPICSPGAAALEATLNPERTDYMYFVSRNDGTHQFCADLSCHNRWVAKYQR
jgi:UPF0755 protein